MSLQKAVVRRYLEAFARSDREAVLACLTDDVRWDIYGHRHLRGREAFAAEIVPPEFEERPVISTDRLVEDHHTVVAIGSVRSRRRDGPPLVVAFCDVFTFRGGSIRRLESFVVPVGDADPAPDVLDVPDGPDR